jgi:UDP-glucose-4-epimerase GalE
MPEVLVTGGAGYIGSHTLRELERGGYQPVCFDNLSTGFRSFAGDTPFIHGDLGNPQDIELAMSIHKVEAVVHFASHALVEESCRNPYKYYHDNILNCLNLLEGMKRHGVRLLVFSSSCATYGIPDRVPISESHALNPVNPYGTTKMVIERILGDYASAHGMRHVALRYFNAAGAAHDGTIGELHDPETHLIPRLLDVVLGKAESARVFGNDYPTPDGTCVRDYIHVLDLARAHKSALDLLFAGGDPEIFNLGTGEGCSVLQVIQQARATTGCAIPVAFEPRRAGDPPTLVANPARAFSGLGWKPCHSSLEEILETAWRWHQKARPRT